MKGLLIKDFCLLRNQRKLLLIYPILAVWFTVMNNDGFGFSFLMMMASILVVSTISYDEVDRSLTHLFTLPFERKTYVLEKFVLGGILAAASLVLATACSAGRLLFRPDLPGTELGPMIVFSACAAAVMLAVMLPIRIRFGGDQGRIVIFAAFGVVALGAVLVSKVLPVTREQMTQVLTQLSLPALMLICAAAAVILLAVGYLLGVRWIRQKEF